MISSEFINEFVCPEQTNEKNEKEWYKLRMKKKIIQMLNVYALNNAILYENTTDVSKKNTYKYKVEAYLKAIHKITNEYADYDLINISSLIEKKLVGKSIGERLTRWQDACHTDVNGEGYSTYYKNENYPMINVTEITHTDMLRILSGNEETFSNQNFAIVFEVWPDNNESITTKFNPPLHNVGLNNRQVSNNQVFDLPSIEAIIPTDERVHFTPVEQVNVSRLREECKHLNIRHVGVSRSDLITELKANGVFEIDLRISAEQTPCLDSETGTNNEQEDPQNINTIYEKMQEDILRNKHEIMKIQQYIAKDKEYKKTMQEHQKPKDVKINPLSLFRKVVIIAIATLASGAIVQHLNGYDDYPHTCT